MWSLGWKLELGGRSVTWGMGASRLSKHKTGGFPQCSGAGGGRKRGGVNRVGRLLGSWDPVSWTAAWEDSGR